MSMHVLAIKALKSERGASVDSFLILVPFFHPVSKLALKPLSSTSIVFFKADFLLTGQ